MSNNWTLLAKNLVQDKDIVIVSSTGTVTEFPISNWRNPLPTRKVRFLSDASVEVIWDLNSVDTGYRVIESAVIWNHNFEYGTTINWKANNTLSWGTPSYDSGVLGVSFDYTSDPAYLYDIYGIPAGMNEKLIPNRSHCHKFPSNIGIYRYIRMLITSIIPNNADNFEIAKLFLGRNLQVSVNIEKEWLQSVSDYSYRERLNCEADFFNIYELGYNFDFEFSYQQRLDARIARYANLEIGREYCFISIEPENNNVYEEVRKDALTLYGELYINDVVKEGYFNNHSFKAHFEEAVINVPVEFPEYVPTEVTGDFTLAASVSSFEFLGSNPHPKFKDYSTGVNSEAVTDHIVTLPTNVDIGDIYLIFLFIDGHLEIGEIGTPSGWTKQTSGSIASTPPAPNNVVSYATYWRVRTGSEGATVTITTANACESEWFCALVAEHGVSTLGIAGNIDGGIGSYNEVATLAGVDTVDRYYLWLAYAGINGNYTVSSFPASTFLLNRMQLAGASDPNGVRGSFCTANSFGINYVGTHRWDFSGGGTYPNADAEGNAILWFGIPAGTEGEYP